MIHLALERVPTQYHVRRKELEALQRTILEGRDADTVWKSQKTPFFSKLPVELISEVFLFAMEADSAFPALACLVCSHWRTISLSMPILWQIVTLSYMAPVKKLTLWLERSKNRITGLRIRNTINRVQLYEALSFCGSDFFSSLKSIYCEVDVVLLTSGLLNIPDVHELNLEDIHLSPPNRQVGTLSPLSPLVPLDRISTVRSLILDYITVDWSIVAPRLSHLRVLIIRTRNDGAPATEQLYGLLSANPYLEKLVLETESAMEVRHFRNNGRVVLAHISHLELLGPMKAGTLVAQLFLPLLEHFTISRCLSPADQVMDALQPSSMTITELSLQMCHFSPERLASFLKTKSRLTKLEITHTASAMDVVVDAVAGSQQVADEATLACPQLKHVNFSHSTSLNGGPIVRLVKPRLTESVNPSLSSSLNSVPAKIESIHIDGCPNIDPSVPEWLRSRVREISCTYMTKREARRIRQ